jgi:glycosyltransferase involved in cell wall biosynthesis
MHDAAPSRLPVAPTVSIGLPVYNGSDYLTESLDALLAQTFTDFELIISDNASTDTTAEICRDYAAGDERIRYVRQRTNIGAAANHMYVAAQARGPYFKWASHDDLYAPDLVSRCVEELERRPDVILVHVRDALIDGQGGGMTPVPYLLRTDDPSPAVRLRSCLWSDPGGNDFYGVIRTDVLRRIRPHGSYYNADRTYVSSLALQGRFHVIDEVMYFRRDHPDRISRSSTRDRCVALDPRRASRLRHPVPRLYGEYLVGFVGVVLRAPISPREKVECLGELGRWAGGRLASRAAPRARTGAEATAQHGGTSG